MKIKNIYQEMVKYRAIKCIPTLISVMFFLVGLIFNSFNFLLSGILLFWGVNVAYCFENINKRIYFLVFNIVLFGFFLSGITIDMFKGQIWWESETSHDLFALNSIMLSLICLFSGHYLFDKIQGLKFEDNRRFNEGYFAKSVNSKFIKNLRILSCILFYFSFIFCLVLEIEKFLIMRHRDYAELYSSFKSNLPSIFGMISSMCSYFLFMYLSTLPKKSDAFIALSLYVLLAVPNFLIGARTAIVLHIIVFFLYCFTRDSINMLNTDDNKVSQSKKWIGKLEYSFASIVSPFFLFIMGIWDYIRDGSNPGLGMIEAILDLFHKQGSTYHILCLGHRLMPKFEVHGFVNYTFGEIIDYFSHGRLSQILFGTHALSEFLQSVEKALYSNRFDHKLAYTYDPQAFIAGHGWGSSYILEVYADFGYIGIVLFSFILGAIFSRMLDIMNKNSFCMYLSLIFLSNVYFIPRGPALSCIHWIFFMQFIIPTFICYLLAKLFIKDYSVMKN